MIAAANEDAELHGTATVTVTGVNATPEVITVTQRTFASKPARPVTNLLSLGFDDATQSSVVQILWGAPPEGCLSTKVTYKNRSTGEVVVVDVSNSDTETTLTDVGNRLEHPDDLLYVSSALEIEETPEPVETYKRGEQLVHYMASGERTEKTVYDGVPNTEFKYAYAKQDRILRLASVDEDGGRVYVCSRVAELSPETTNTTFSMTIHADQTVGVGGCYAAVANVISDAETASVFDPATNALAMRYKVKTNGGSYTVEETLVPKTTPIETEAAIGDARSGDRGDNMTTAGVGYEFVNAFDGFVGNNHCWIGSPGEPNAAVTFELKQPMILTRMMIWPSGDDTNLLTWGIYGFQNPRRFELWGSAEIAADKPSSYWNDAPEGSYTGTLKAEWVYLGLHDVERLDKKDATATEIINRGHDGHHVILPETATPVKYVRIYFRNYYEPGDLPSETAEYWQSFFAIGEISFFGYAQ
jgi:hypothetical protein